MTKTSQRPRLTGEYDQSMGTGEEPSIFANVILLAEQWLTEKLCYI